MKKITLLLLIIANTAMVAYAQNDPNAKKILDNVSSKLKSFKGVSAGFSYTTLNKKNVKQGTVSGIIDFKGQKYHIKQGANEIFCNGSQMWNYSAENNEVTLSAIDGDDKTLSPQKLLSNSFVDKDFGYKLISSSGQFHQIQLTPTDKRKNFKQVTVFVDKAQSLITKANIIDKNDNKIEFTLSNVKTNVALADSKFEFNAKAHPGVEVINN